MNEVKLQATSRSRRRRRVALAPTSRANRQCRLSREQPNRGARYFHRCVHRAPARQEILGLSVDDLDFEAKQIFVRQSAWRTKLLAPKTKASVAPVTMALPLEETLREYLKTWKPNPNRLLFAARTGNPHLLDRIVRLKLWPILDALGIPRCGMHAFRHGCASLMMKSGASLKIVQEQLRHADPMTTARMYIHTIGQERREAADLMARDLVTTGRKLNSNANFLN